MCLRCSGKSWYDFVFCQHSPSSLAAIEKFTRDDGVPLSPEDSIIGPFRYLTFSRPDIAFSRKLNKDYQILHAPTTTHWTVFKRIKIYKRFNLMLD
jgi:hypothetical protein